MNTNTHTVAPEEVMAFLDRELSAADAQIVGAHIALCPECENLAEKFRSTSQALSRWNVEAIPAKVEKSATELASKTRSGLRIGKGNVSIRTSFWTWKQWAAGLGATAALLVLIMAITIPNLLRSRMAANEASAVAQRHERTEEKSIREISPYVSKLPADAAKAGGGGGDKLALPSSSPTIDRLELYAKIQKPAQVEGQPIMPAPMIARTVSLSIVVKDFAASRSSLDMLLVQHHGYSAQLSVSTPEDAPRSLQASLRIPASELSSAVADLKSIGRVENESQSGEEVTQQHTDVVARLKNSRETEQRFRTILQQRTGNAVEVLQVEEGIARVRGDIERMEAEQKALEHRVDFATVELQLTEEYKAQLNPPAASVATRIHNALVTGYRNASDTTLGIVLFSVEYGPALVIWLMILLLPVVLLWRRYRKTLATG